MHSTQSQCSIVVSNETENQWIDREIEREKGREWKDKKGAKNWKSQTFSSINHFNETMTENCKALHSYRKTNDNVSATTSTTIQ